MNVAMPALPEYLLGNGAFVAAAFLAAVLLLARFFRERRRTIKVKIVV